MIVSTVAQDAYGGLAVHLSICRRSFQFIAGVVGYRSCADYFFPLLSRLQCCKQGMYQHGSVPCRLNGTCPHLTRLLAATAPRVYANTGQETTTRPPGRVIVVMACVLRTPNSLKTAQLLRTDGFKQRCLHTLPNCHTRLLPTAPHVCVSTG